MTSVLRAGVRHSVSAYQTDPYSRRVGELMALLISSMEFGICAEHPQREAAKVIRSFAQSSSLGSAPVPMFYMQNARLHSPAETQRRREHQRFDSSKGSNHTKMSAICEWSSILLAASRKMLFLVGCYPRLDFPCSLRVCGRHGFTVAFIPSVHTHPQIVLLAIHLEDNAFLCVLRVFA